MPFPLLAAGLLTGGLGALGKIGAGLFQNSEANKIDPVYNPYETSEYAKSQLGLAQQLFGGRMFGAGDLEKNIMASQAGFNQNVNRNATDSSQALALGALGQGQSNNAFQNLQIQEQQNKYGLLDNLNNAYQTMTNEDWKVYQDMMKKYEIDMGQKNDLRESSWQNIWGGVSDIGGGLIQAGTAGLFGGGNNQNERYQFPNQFDSSVADVPNPSYSPGMIDPSFMGRSTPSYGVNPQANSFIGPRRP